MVQPKRRTETPITDRLMYCLVCVTAIAMLLAFVFFIAGMFMIGITNSLLILVGILGVTILLSMSMMVAISIAGQEEKKQKEHLDTLSFWYHTFDTEIRELDKKVEELQSRYPHGPVVIFIPFTGTTPHLMSLN